MKRRVLGIFILCLLAATVFNGALAAERDIDLPSSGDRTEEITRVQKRLFDLGYYTYKPTGSFGSVTSRAIALFQSMIGDEQTGELTRNEWDILFSDEAPLRQFTATVPITFKGQSEFFSVTGEAVPWSKVQTLLVPGNAYIIYNCATGDSCEVVYASGTGHGDFTVTAGSVAEYHLEQWLGKTNSFYKIACVMNVEGTNTACSAQWDGEDRLCVYFTGSTSHVLGFEDTEHAELVEKAAGLIASEVG